MANLFNDLKPKANPVKNGFDLSERHTYTARAGMLYPVMTKEVIPGDYFFRHHWIQHTCTGRICVPF